jgi:aspartate carbamoyltransferase regulatory subunit
MNVPSRKMGRKDIVKVEGLFLKPEETNRIALIAPRATVNLIKDYRIVEKRPVELPETLIGVFPCPNPSCISNAEEPITPVIRVLRQDPPLLQCKYCSRILSPEELLGTSG